MKTGLQRIALVMALGALGVLGWSVWHPQPAPNDAAAELTLWTAGAAQPVTGVTGIQRALPDASTAPGEITRVPDVAFLRRAYPKLRRIEVRGDGVSPAEAEALRGLLVKWEPPVPALPTPAIVAVAAPRTIAVGQRMRVEGRVRGISAGSVTTLRMEGPDGGAHSVELRGETNGEAAFAIASNPAAAAGAYEWKLQLGPAGAPLRVGAQVVRQELPRVLILQASPNSDPGRLQRWLAEAGAPVTSRTRVSAEHMRFATANDAPGEFARLEPELLKRFDVVVTSEAAILDLSPEERTAVSDAMRSRGLGVLVTGEAANQAQDDPFSPWTLKPDTAVEAGENTRVARLRLADGTELGEPITTLASELTTVPLQRWLVRDAQDRIACVAVPRGRGWLARSLVVDTWRWLQGGHPEVFAAYWSGVLTSVATPAATGRWHLIGGEGPIFVHAPVHLAWVTSAEKAPPNAKIATRAGLEAALPLTRDPTDPMRHLGIFYPSQTGWYEVQVAGGAALAFYVSAPDSLGDLRAEDRHAATARLLSASAGLPVATESPAPHATSHWLEVMAFAVFVLSAGVLFLDVRRA